MSIVLKNPFLFLLILLMAGGFYVAYTLNLLGPMMHMANAASTQGLDIAKARLREYIMSSESSSSAQPMAMSGRQGEDIDMDTLDSAGKKKRDSMDNDEI